ncbi:MAG TPA: hypothetical protein VII25_12250 [Candidatus Acidoferrum sp.]
MPSKLRGNGSLIARTGTPNGANGVSLVDSFAKAGNATVPLQAVDDF